MNISWLFEIDTYKWSTKAVTFSAVDYTAKVFPDSFRGITMGWDINGGGLIYPSDLEFEIDNADDGLARTDLEGEYCTIKLVTDDALTRTWKFKIQTAILSYGKIHIYCSGLLQEYLNGVYPNTPHPRETWVSANHQPEDGEYDNYRIPVIFGTAYIPLMYIYHTVDATGYYVLGDDIAYTIDEIKSPAESGSFVWTSGSYTFNQSSDAGYKLAEFVIAPTNTPGTYTEGTWSSGQKPLVKYSKTSGSTTLPATILSTVLQDFGVPAGDIDTGVTFVAAAALYASQNITWNGGFYRIQDRESVLSNLLIQCDSTLYVSDKIELYQFSKTSKETFTTAKTKKLSYHPSRVTKTISDSGHVSWADAGFPQDNLVGKALVPIDSTTVEPDGTTFECRFIDDDVVAQTLGILHFQRKLAGKDSISFSTVGSAISTLETLKPADVITVNDTMFGGSQDMIISSLEIQADLTVNISGRSFSILQEFDDISPAAVPVTVDPTDPLLGLPDAVYISGNNVFKFLSGSATPISSPIVLTAILQGDLSVYDWEYWTGAAWANLSGTQDEKTYSLAYDNAAWSTDTLLIRCLSGTISSEMTISKLSDGDDGVDGVGLVYRGVYVARTYYYTSTRRDVVYYSGTYYIYNVATSTSGNAETSWVSDNWEIFSVTFDSVATDLLLAQDVAITKNLNVGGGTGTNYAGMSGDGSSSTSVRIWAGSATKTSAPFRVTNAGDLYASNATISGAISIGAGSPTISTTYTAAKCTNANADQTSAVNINAALTASTLGFGSSGKITFASSSNKIYGSSSQLYMEAGTSHIYANTNGPITVSASGSGDGLNLQAGGGTFLSSGSGYNITLDSGNDVTLDASSSDDILFKFGGTSKMKASSDRLYPITDSQIMIGGAGLYYLQLAADSVFDSGGLLSDTYDDLDEMQKHRPVMKTVIDPETLEETEELDLNSEGLQKLDIYSITDSIVDYESARQKLRNDCGDMINETDIEEYIMKYDEAGWLLGRNMGRYGDMTAGGLRQLDHVVNDLAFELSEWIYDHEQRLISQATRITILETAIVKETM